RPPAGQTDLQVLLAQAAVARVHLQQPGVDGHGLHQGAADGLPQGRVAADRERLRGGAASGGTHRGVSAPPSADPSWWRGNPLSAAEQPAASPPQARQTTPNRAPCRVTIAELAEHEPEVQVVAVLRVRGVGVGGVVGYVHGHGAAQLSQAERHDLIQVKNQVIVVLVGVLGVESFEQLLDAPLRHVPPPADGGGGRVVVAGPGGVRAPPPVDAVGHGGQRGAQRQVGGQQLQQLERVLLAALQRPERRERRERRLGRLGRQLRQHQGVQPPRGKRFLLRLECPEGVVQEDAFKDIYAKFFPHGNSSLYAHYVFKAFDVNCNGAITFRDLLVTLSTLLRGSIYEKLRWTFKLYDINGDGCITRSELTEIVVAIHELMGRRAHQVEDDRKCRDQVDRVFRKLDINQDGVITIEEFMESCLKDEIITRSMAMFDTSLLVACLGDLAISDNSSPPALYALPGPGPGPSSASAGPSSRCPSRSSGGRGVRFQVEAQVLAEAQQAEQALDAALELAHGLHHMPDVWASATSSTASVGAGTTGAGTSAAAGWPDEAEFGGEAVVLRRQASATGKRPARPRSKETDV
ncbi:Kv channel-interacting protein 1, partial [Frankliniella fusca]